MTGAMKKKIPGTRKKTTSRTPVDRILASLPDARRRALQRLRRTLHAAVPRATDCIAYGLPSLRLDGRYLVSYGAAKNHLAFYPGAVLDPWRKDLAGFETTRGSIHFQPEGPIPAALVRRLVKARVARIAGADRAVRPRRRTRARAR